MSFAQELKSIANLLKGASQVAGVDPSEVPNLRKELAARVRSEGGVSSEIKRERLRLRKVMVFQRGLDRLNRFVHARSGEIKPMREALVNLESRRKSIRREKDSFRRKPVTEAILRRKAELDAEQRILTQNNKLLSILDRLLELQERFRAHDIDREIEVDPQANVQIEYASDLDSEDEEKKGVDSEDDGEEEEKEKEIAETRLPTFDSHALRRAAATAETLLSKGDRSPEELYRKNRDVFDRLLDNFNQHIPRVRELTQADLIRLQQLIDAHRNNNSVNFKFHPKLVDVSIAKELTAVEQHRVRLRVIETIIKVDASFREIRDKALLEDVKNLPKGTLVRKKVDNTLREVTVQLELGSPANRDAPSMESLPGQALAIARYVAKDWSTYGYYASLLVRMESTMEETQDSEVEFLRGTSDRGPDPINFSVLEDIETVGSLSLVGRYSYTITIYRMTPGRHSMRHGSTRVKVDLPERLQNCKGLINPYIGKKHGVNRCFRHAVVIAANINHPEAPPARDKNRIQMSKWDRFDVYNWDGIEFPTSEDDIARFEELNGIAVNIFRYDCDQDHVFCFRTARNMPENPDHVANLFSHPDVDGQQHFMAITGLSALLRNQISENKSKMYICPNCLRSSITKEALHKHFQNCLKTTNSVERELALPKDLNVKFTQYKYTQRVPLTIHYDTETMFHQIGGSKVHVPMSCWFVILCMYTHRVLYSNMFVGEDCVKEMLRDMFVQTDNFYPAHNPEIFGATPFRLGRTDCFFCKEAIDEPYVEGNEANTGDPSFNQHPVQHHDHFLPNASEDNPNFIGWAHRKCNLQAKITNMHIPAIAMNGDRYDTRLITRELMPDIMPETHPMGMTYRSKHPSPALFNKIEGMHTTQNGIRNLKVRNIRFQDARHYLEPSTSLDKWVKDFLGSIPTSELKVLEQMSADLVKRRPHLKLDPELLRQKGFFPYEVCTDLQVLQWKGFPSRKRFYSSLTRKGISKRDHYQAKKVFKSTGCRNLEDYMCIYLMCDVALQAECVVRYSQDGLNNFGLDPLWTMGIPGFTWVCALKHSGVNIELHPDLDMYHMSRKGFRGGITSVYRHDVSASQEEGHHIGYWDCTGLYGVTTLGQFPLPVGDHRWEYNGEEGKEHPIWSNPETAMNFILGLRVRDTLNDRGEVIKADDRCYLIEADYHIPDELHDQLKDYPPMPESRTIPTEWLSQHELDQYARLGAEHDVKARYMVQTLFDKEEYVCYSALAQKFLKLGIRITKVHRVMSSKQSGFFQGYINGLAANRQKATDENKPSSSALFKLAMNGLYGKTCEDVMKYRDTEIADPEHLPKAFNDYRFHHVKELNEELFLVSRKKVKVETSKPVFIGAAILDLSKLVMLEFWYDTIKPRWPDASVLYTDTDSFVIQTSSSILEAAAHDAELRNRMDLNDMMKKQPVIFQRIFGHLPPEEITKIRQNLKRAGTFSNETNGVDVVRFIGLRAKTYALYDANGNKICKSKGVSYAVQPGAEAYEDVVEGKSDQVKVNATLIRSKRNPEDGTFRLSTIDETKVALTRLNVKRYSQTADPKGPTLPYGHYSLRK